MPPWTARAVVLDHFVDVTRHLATVHPSRYRALLDGVTAMGWTHVRPVTDQTVALRLVVLADRLYDADRSRCSRVDCRSGSCSPPEMLAGGYRKKYYRALSRLTALARGDDALTGSLARWARARRIRQEPARRQEATKAARRSQEVQGALRRAGVRRGAGASATRSGREGFVLADLDPRSTPGFDGDKADGQEALGRAGRRDRRVPGAALRRVQGGGQRSLLLVVQGMDTSGKGGIMRHVVGQMDPQGVQYTAVQGADGRGARAPVPVADPQRPAATRARSGSSTARSTRTCSSCGSTTSCPGRRGRGATRRSTTSRPRPSPTGTTDRQGDAAHLLRRAEGPARPSGSSAPDKHWKYNPGDVDERLHWPEYHGGLPGGAREDARPRLRPGTSSRPTASGTPGWPCRTSSSSTSRRWTRSGRRPTSTSRPRSSGSPSVSRP